MLTPTADMRLRVLRTECARLAIYKRHLCDAIRAIETLVAFDEHLAISAPQLYLSLEDNAVVVLQALGPLSHPELVKRIRNTAGHAHGRFAMRVLSLLHADSRFVFKGHRWHLVATNGVPSRRSPAS